MYIVEQIQTTSLLEITPVSHLDAKLKAMAIMASMASMASRRHSAAMEHDQRTR
jgi:hypothetical protein